MQAARPIRGPHGGWQKQEIDALRQSIEAAEQSGESLRSVFDRMSRQLGRKPNSIRNFYYAQVRAEQGEGGARATPFETFSKEEVERLVEQVLTAKAQGVSVRACVQQLAGGDRTRMLRYQNKYRSTVRTRPELVRGVMERLNEQGRAYVSPYAGEESPVELTRLKTRAQESGDAHIGRLGARCDMLRIALDDEHKRFERLQSEAGGMISLIKEYVALPEDARQTGLNAFCEQAAQSLSRVECAMMDAPQ